MNCFHPIKLYLSDDSQAKRRACEYMPLEWRYASYIYVPCGKCAACLSRRKSEWTFRLANELSVSESAYFITLTYDDEHVPYKDYINECTGEYLSVPVVSKRDVQLFLKRLRFNIRPYKIRYFIVSEYGKEHYRPHYHMIMFNYPHDLDRLLTKNIEESWQNGFVRIDPVNSARINYVCSYCLDNSTLPEYLDKNFMLSSRRPGIGSSYCDNDNIVRFHRDNLCNMCTSVSNGKAYNVPMPRYYRSRIFDEQQANEIYNEVTKLHIEQRTRLARAQKRWLRNRRIKVTPETIRIPYPGSPLDAELQARNEFERNVEKRCKLKKL